MSYLISYKDCPYISGIYRIVFPNGKSYIGQSKNIKQRIRHHNNPNNLETLVDKKIKEKFPNHKVEQFEILEEIDSNNFQELNKKEQYYIKKYHSHISENGYNVSWGGQDKSPGEILIKFSKEEALEIALLIKNNKTIRFEEIANRYNCHMNTIKKINCGISPYIFKDFSYPIRSKDESRILRSILDQEIIYNILHDLRYTSQTMIQIGKKYNLCRNTISDINKGKKQPLQNYNYPARKTRKGNK